jgi:hypothetical protein
MTKTNKHNIQAQATVTRRSRWYIVGTIFLAVGLTAGYWVWQQDSAAAGPNASDLIGRWLRADGGYVLALSDPDPEGRLKAVYFNPRPINVSRAEWKLKNGLLSVFIELRDVNYPGSTYTLDYKPTTGKLTGIYFQAALGQQFEVEFERMK